MIMLSIEDLPWQGNTPYVAMLKVYLAALLSSEKLSRNEKAERSKSQLSAVLQHCLATVPFYQRRIGREFQSAMLSEFARLPILTKNDIRKHSPLLISNSFNKKSNQRLVHAFHTSGSTGTPIKVLRGQRNIVFCHALGLYYQILQQRRFEFSNVNIVTCKGNDFTPRSWSPGLSTGPGFTLDIREDSETIFNSLLEMRPNYIQTHPSMLKRLIDLSIEKRQQLGFLREVSTFGELLEQNVKSACKSNWGVSVSDLYSSEEMGIIGFSCPYGEHYHVMDENVLVEIVGDNDKPLPKGQPGRIIVTQLKNLVMPLLRYDIGDIGVECESSECHLNLPILKSIEGRRRNLVKLPSGDMFHPVFDEEKILAIANIKQYQVIQKSLEEIQINILGAPLKKTKEQALSHVFGDSFKGNFRFVFNYENELPFSKRNKFELFKSEI